MQWPPRMEVAIKVAQALEYLTSIPGIPVYADLNPYRVLFDEVQYCSPHGGLHS